MEYKFKLENFRKASFKLKEALVRSKQAEFKDDLLNAGLVQTFEFTLELAWKVLKAYLSSEGIVTKTPKDTVRQAFKIGFISDGDLWLEALGDRNLTSHIYNDEIAINVVGNIANKYAKILIDLEQKFNSV